MDVRYIAVACLPNIFRSISAARDCSGLYGTGKHNGTYTILPYGPSGASVPVYCEYNTDGVWTVIRTISLKSTHITQTHIVSETKKQTLQLMFI